MENREVSRPRVFILSSGHTVTDPRVFHREALTLARAGYRVLVTGIKVGNGWERKVGEKHGIKILTFPPPKSRFYRLTVHPLKCLRAALAAKGRLYHIQDPELLPIGLVLKMLGRRVVCDIHEDYPRQLRDKSFIPGWLRPVISRGWERWERFACTVFDGVITATEEIAERIARGVQKRRRPIITTVKNYPRGERGQGNGEWPMANVAPSPVSNIPFASKNGKRRPFRIVHLASVLTRERGITLLLDALEMLPDVQLVLAGKFCSQAYEQEVRSHPAFSRVRYLGLVPYEVCLDWYAQSDVGVVPSLPVLGYESALPIKMFEFMSAGLPVVVPDFPVLREIVERSGCGLVFTPQDPVSCARAITYIKTHPELGWKMGKNGQRAVREVYNWENEGKKLLQLYERIC